MTTVFKLQFADDGINKSFNSRAHCRDARSDTSLTYSGHKALTLRTKSYQQLLVKPREICPLTGLASNTSHGSASVKKHALR